MSKIPPEIAKFRTRGTEIKKVGDAYYIQRITSKWDKTLGRPKKVVLEYLGMVDENGIHPKTTKKVNVNFVPYSREYGATYVLRLLTNDIYDKLKEFFCTDADWIYVVAMLRTFCRTSFSSLQNYYNNSYIQEIFPKLPLSSSSLSGAMTRLGYRRDQMVKFMKSYTPDDNAYVIFDGTSIICNSQNIYEAQRGYNSHGCHDPQLNLMYALARDKDRLSPVFYKEYPGSIRDVSAFKNMLAESGIKIAVLLADKGFVKQSTLNEFEESNLTYIMPLRRTSLEYDRTPLLSRGCTGFTGCFQYNDRTIWYYEQPVKPGDKHRYFLFLDEKLQYEECRKSNKKISVFEDDIAKQQKLAKKQIYFGSFVLKTNDLSINAINCYKTFKMRNDVEQLFDIYKSETNFATTGAHSSQTCEATLFLNHLSIMMIYKIYNLLRENHKLKKYSCSHILQDYLAFIKVCNNSEKWLVEPVTKELRLAIEALGLSVPEEVN